MWLTYTKYNFETCLKENGFSKDMVDFHRCKKLFQINELTYSFINWLSKAVDYYLNYYTKNILNQTLALCLKVLGTVFFLPRYNGSNIWN